MTVAVGVDLGATNLRAALIDVDTGQLIGAEVKSQLPNKAPTEVAGVVEKLVSTVDPKNQRFGVGVGFAGMLRGWTGVVVNAPNLGWREVDFRSLLRERLGERVELYNDLNAIAFGESKYGSARGIKDVLCIYVGTGVGGGMVLDGRVYVGSTHLAGEIGHTKVVANGRLCGCGSHGCLEAYVSGAHLQARAKEELTKRPSLAVDLAGGIDKLHAGHLEEAAARGDSYADALWNEAARYLGMSLANAVTLLNPSRLVMGGGLWQKSPELRRRTLVEFERAANRPSLDGFRVVDTALGDNAGVLGAAAYITLPAA